MRSVPLGSSDGVMTARPPYFATASAILWSSVATITSSRDLAFFTASTTHATRGFPASMARGLPGNLLEPNLLGIIPYVFIISPSGPIGS